jgi:hypothetical protein
MSEITTHRDERGRFQTGNSGGGRPRGSRNKLGEAFIEDLRDCWNRRGIEVLERCAEQDPAALLRVIASLLPKTIDLNVAVDVADFADRFAQAAALLGQDVGPPRRLRKRLPGQPPLIENGDGR